MVCIIYEYIACVSQTSDINCRYSFLSQHHRQNYPEKKIVARSGTLSGWFLFKIYLNAHPGICRCL